MINNSNNKMIKIMDIFNNKTLMHIALVSAIALTILFYAFPLEVDLTRNDSNSISQKAKVVLKSLDVKEGELEVKYFSAITNSEIDTNALDRIKTVFNQFKKYNKKIEYKIIDLDSNPEELAKHPNADTNCVLLNYKGKEICMSFEMFASKTLNVLEIDIERQLINEFIKLKDLSKYDIYYTTSHGEKFDSDEYSEFNGLLERLGYNLKKIDIANGIPKEVSTLYVMAPKRDFNELEIDKLKNYVSSGNSLFLSLEANSNSDENSLVDYPNLKEFCHSLGINIIDRVIVDKIQDTKLIGVYAEEDEDASKLEGLNPIVYMPQSRMMSIDEGNNSYKKTKTMMSGELASYPLIVKLESENTKILISATPDMFNNTYITNNKIFDTYLIKWIDNFKTNVDIKPFIYREYKADATEFKPALVLGIIEIMIPGLALYIGFEIARKRVMTIKSKAMK